MNPATLGGAFRLATWCALVGWLMLFFLPHWPGVDTWLPRGVVGLLSLLYVGLLVAALRQPRGPGDRPGFLSLRGVVALFRNPVAILAAWVHILAFDLMVGWHIRREGAALGIEHGWLLPCYLLAMLFGPLGLLAFFALAAWYGPPGYPG